MINDIFDIKKRKSVDNLHSVLFKTLWEIKNYTCQIKKCVLVGIPMCLNIWFFVNWCWWRKY